METEISDSEEKFCSATAKFMLSYYAGVEAKCCLKKSQHFEQHNAYSQSMDATPELDPTFHDKVYVKYWWPGKFEE